MNWSGQPLDKVARLIVLGHEPVLVETAVFEGCCDDRNRPTRANSFRSRYASMVMWAY